MVMAVPDLPVRVANIACGPIDMERGARAGALKAEGATKSEPMSSADDVRSLRQMKWFARFESLADICSAQADVR
jgi:hypothetical protein